MPSVSNPQNKVTAKPAAPRPSRAQCILDAAAVYFGYLDTVAAAGAHKAEVA